jgi:hypothetical protein
VRPSLESLLSTYVDLARGALTVGGALSLPGLGLVNEEPRAEHGRGTVALLAPEPMTTAATTGTPPGLVAR